MRKGGRRDKSASLQLAIPADKRHSADGTDSQEMDPCKEWDWYLPCHTTDWGEYSTIKPSKAQDIILRNVKPAKPLNVAPYGMTGYEKNNDLNEEGTAYWNWDKKPVEAGLDVKYGLSSNLILDLTVNTDFAQVEADDEKINLTRMALYFPEKRLFSSRGQASSISTRAVIIICSTAVVLG